LDGIDFKWFEDMANFFRNGAFNFKPSRRIYIFKSDGGKRPLSIPSPRDKIVQQAMKMVLEFIFEKEFMDISHGFRLNKGCHTVLNEVKMKFGYLS
jgi:retron-type reverse transcriptase